VAVGDLNGDHHADLAVVSLGYGYVSVLLNRGGSFRRVASHHIFAAVSVAIGDLNRDGKLDLATANAEDGTVSILLNRSGPCTVPTVIGKRLDAARQAVLLSGCRVGKVSAAYSKRVARGRVVSQRPRPGTALPARGRVDLVVSRGRR
jgi:hypothetical protein